ncbi:MAG: N-(5'-phosphoribosyl)anthranilate isomerase [Bacteroidota bacterium]
MLKQPTKASRIANLTDARYFAAWDVAWLGFCLDSSAAHFLRPQELMAIREWVTGPQIVGEFGWQAPEEIRQTAELLRLDAVQVGPLLTASQLVELADLTLFQELVLESHSNVDELRAHLTAAAPAVNYFLLNFAQNHLDWDSLQRERPFSTAELQALCRDFPVYLDLSLPLDQLDELLQRIRPLGLSVQGGEEEQVGFKSFDELDEWFEAMEVQE